MVKNKKKDNALIKRKNLILRLKNAGIGRVSVEGVLALERVLEKKLEGITEILKEEMIVQGRKTLKKEDVENVVKKIEDRGDDWEI